MNTPLWSLEDVVARLRAEAAPHASGYHAMYRGDWGAIVREPNLMFVPVDDHLVHRGDGVFETLLAESRAVYHLEAHLERLERSARALRLAPPPLSFLREKILDTFRAAEQPRALARVLLGRGPGGFGVDPRECMEPSLYIVVYTAPPPFMDRVPEGARVVFSRIPPKGGGLATSKTCNYLPNVLMKMEALDAGAHFVLGVDGEGYVTESYTENLAAVDRKGALVVTPPLHHLPGTTLARVVELAQEAGRPIREQRLRPEDLWGMAELLVVGTTAYVTSVRELEGRPFPVGPVGRDLDARLRGDIRGNPRLRQSWTAS